MPKTPSAKKALRQNTRRRALNTVRKKTLSGTIKKYKKLLKDGKSEEAKSFLPSVYKTVDKMAKVNFIKKGKANRLKSRLSKSVK